MLSSLAAALAAVAAAGPASAAEALDVSAFANTTVVPRWDCFELAFKHAGAYADPFFDVAIDLALTSPSGRRVPVGGFFYGCDERPEAALAPSDGHGLPKVAYKFPKADTWKARFAPDEPGRWTYEWTFRNASGGEARGRGEFTCIVGRRPLPGFVRQDPASPMRWVMDDGTAYFPIGYQDGQFDSQGLCTALATCSMEGPFRMDRKGRPDPPPGAMFVPGPGSNPQNADVQFRRFAACGFNMLRFSQQNFSYTIMPSQDRINVAESLMTDELLQRSRAYGFRIMYGLFGYMNVSAAHPEDAAAMARVRRLVKYSVDRWGAWVDIWELLNEQHAHADWVTGMAAYLKSLDPYRHPVTTSWERPELDGIDLSAPHQYVGLNEQNAPHLMAEQAARWKKPGKPVIVGEAGNSVGDSKPNSAKPMPGVGGVWDARSAMRMRLRNWAGLMNEVSFVFWNTSGAKDAHFMNIWLGPREREYVRAMQAFAYDLGAGLKMVPMEVSDGGVRGWAAANQRRAGAYLHHWKGHDSPVRGARVTLDVPVAAKAYWISPENAAILASADVPAGRQTLEVPEFVIDIALLVTPDGPPDMDRDGLANDADPDDDNDGVPDDRDAFPLDPSEWADADGDLIGDRLDADVDADGRADDLNGNGLPDRDELDIDGDGVPRTGAVPWDAFPLDPKEWRDTDGDSTGDNADADDDGDGFSDEEERAAGTDPLNRLSFPAQ
jgi:hypothetical protein